MFYDVVQEYAFSHLPRSSHGSAHGLLAIPTTAGAGLPLSRRVSRGDYGGDVGSAVQAVPMRRKPTRA